jgi:hypothetical protein
MAMRGDLISLAAAGAAVALAAAGWTGGIAAPSSVLRSADKDPNATVVDVELVIAVDVSYSMDPDEQALQREGYMTGITSREFMQALRSGMNGKVAVTYFEWAGPYDQKIIVPWRLVDGRGHHDQWAANHVEAAELLHHGYRGSGCLLRGLRHRRPGLVRRSDPRPRAIQGSDPHQAGTGSRRSHA